MRYFHPIYLCLLIAIVTVISPPSWANTISFNLDTAASVSVAVYNGDQQMVRTLASGTSLKPGKHTLHWDGLDLDGKAVPAGTYTWKLIQHGGLKSEFLMQLGTSVGHEFWPGQHGGPVALAYDGDHLYMASATAEFSSQLVKMKRKGEKVIYNAKQLEGWPEVSDIALSGNHLFEMNTAQGKLYRRDAATGKKTGEFSPTTLYRTLSGKILTQGWDNTNDMRMRQGAFGIKATHIADHHHRRNLTLKVPNGMYRIKITWGKADTQYQSAVWAEDKWKHSATVKDKDEISDFSTHVTDGSLSLGFNTPPKAKKPLQWWIKSIAIHESPSRITANDETVYIAFGASGRVDAISAHDGSVSKSWQLPVAIYDIAWGPKAPLALSESAVYDLASPKTPVIRNLIHAKVIHYDHKARRLFIGEGKDSHQVKVFDTSYSLKHTFGRKGGRKHGLYNANNYMHLSDIHGDGTGGYYICEGSSAPRRTSHFDAKGHMIKEWYGGQQFYTFACPDPENPNRAWMDSHWKSIMEVDIDYTQKTWKPRATYAWAYDLPKKTMLSRFKMAMPFYAFRYDRDNDGKTEVYLRSEAHKGLWLRPDEASGRMLAFAAAGAVNLRPKGRPATDDQLPDGWAQAVDKVKFKKENGRGAYTGYTWSDANLDGKTQADEFNVIRVDGHGFTGPRGPHPSTHNLFMDKQYNLWFGRNNYGDKRPAYTILPKVGTSPSGAPIWDWRKLKTGPVLPFLSTVDMHQDNDGNLYTLSRDGGDGYRSLGFRRNGGHGEGWPANMCDMTAFIKWNKGGKRLFRVGHKAPKRDNNFPATLQYPISIAGTVPGFIGVADKIVNPCEIWTEDGLYVGGVLDGRVDDGLPDRVYTWWQTSEDEKGKHIFDIKGTHQYDMILGGVLFEGPNDDTLWFGAGWNNVPVFRIHGLDSIKRQQGAIRIKQSTQVASEKGSGLKATFYTSTDLSGTPALRKTTDRIWYGDSGSEKKPWPKPIDSTKRFSARFEGSIEPRYSDDYRFLIYMNNKKVAPTTRGGNDQYFAEPVRLYIDDTLVLNTWDTPTKGRWGFSATASAPIQLTAGKRHRIRLEYQKTASNKAELHLCWESATQAIEHIPTQAMYPAP